MAQLSIAAAGQVVVGTSRRCRPASTGSRSAHRREMHAAVIAPGQLVVVVAAAPVVAGHGPHRAVGNSPGGARRRPWSQGVADWPGCSRCSGSSRRAAEAPAPAGRRHPAGWRRRRRCRGLGRPDHSGRSCCCTDLPPAPGSPNGGCRPARRGAGPVQDGWPSRSSRCPRRHRQDRRMQELVMLDHRLSGTGATLPLTVVAEAHQIPAAGRTVTLKPSRWRR